MDPMEAIRATFFQECEEQLAELEAGLLALQDGTGDADTVNAVFRAVHSIKGGAGAFGLEALVRFAHVLESSLDDMRSGRLEVSAQGLRLLLRAADLLADLVRAARGGEEIDPSHTAPLIEALMALSGATPGDRLDTEGVELDDFAFQPLMIDLDAAPSLEPETIAPASAGFLIEFKPHRSLYAHANETALLLRELGRLGAIEVAMDASGLPPLEALDAEDAYLGWSVRLTGEVGEAEVRAVFDWVEGDCDLSLTPLAARPCVEAARSQATGASAIGGGVSGLDIAALLARVKASVEAPAQPAATGAATSPASAPAPEAPAQTIRVDLDRVDRLIDLVGELVINSAMLAQRVGQALPEQTARGHQVDTVASALEGLEHLIHDIQEGVMAIRAQPVRAVFQRLPRLVREVAAQLGKEVRLITEGEACEVDRTVIERLSDPLVHMIRNAVDHGLESAEDRIAVGKPAEGVVRLSAAHRSGRVVIEVSDDGRGIDRARVRAIAEARGLVSPGAAMSDDEIDQLIFAPGFSTASAVSDISGRGVGMDVVRRQVQALGGRISIASRPGQGCTFTLSLPLTLAVMDGMVVEAGGQTLVIPLTAVLETLQPRAAQIRRLGPCTTLLAVRDEHVPLTDVAQALGFRVEGADPRQSIALLVEDEAGVRSALLVDAIHGQRQVVIKSLEANYGRVRGVAAATILGDGRVALIADVEALSALRPISPPPDATPIPLTSLQGRAA